MRAPPRPPLVPALHSFRLGAEIRQLLRYVGPGFLVTAGFIDPGNWASNIAAGSRHGYALLWVATLSAFILAIVQHAAARLGAVTGLCLAEAAAVHLPRLARRALLVSAFAATVSTALAEVLGVAIGLNMLARVPIPVGAAIAASGAAAALLARSYASLERWTMALVSAVGVGFLVELALAPVDWKAASASAFVPSLPAGSLAVVASVIGAVVMPHGIFLHSEVIQSRAWHVGAERVRQTRLWYEAVDTGFATFVGWCINASMIIVAAAVFHASGAEVTDLRQAEAVLRPMLGNAAAAVFALALVAAGFAALLGAGMAGGSIAAGAAARPYARDERLSRAGVLGSLGLALVVALLVGDAFTALLWSQIMLSIQLPLTVTALVVLTSSRRVMGEHVSSRWYRVLLWAAAGLVALLDVAVIVETLR